MIALVGQVVIIMCLFWTLTAPVREIGNMHYGFHSILLNHIRYVYFVSENYGFDFWIQSSAPNWLFKFVNNGENRPIPPYHRYNHPYVWLMLKENRTYIWYAVLLPVTLTLIYEMIDQISTGYINHKPGDLFFISPARSISYVMILTGVISENNRLKRDKILLVSRGKDLLIENSELKSKIKVLGKSAYSERGLIGPDKEELALSK